MMRNAIFCQIEQIKYFSIENSRTLSGMDIGDLRNLANALEEAAEILRAEVDSRLDQPIAPGGLFADLLQSRFSGADHGGTAS